MDFSDIEHCEKELCDAKSLLAYLELHKQMTSVIYDTMEETTTKTSTTLRVLKDVQNLLSRSKTEFCRLIKPSEDRQAAQLPREHATSDLNRKGNAPSEPNNEAVQAKPAANSKHEVSARNLKTPGHFQGPMRRETSCNKPRAAKMRRLSVMRSTQAPLNPRTLHRNVQPSNPDAENTAVPPRRIKHNRNYPKPWLDPPPPPPAPRAIIEPSPGEAPSASVLNQINRRQSAAPPILQRRPRLSVASVRAPQNSQRRATFAVPSSASTVVASQVNRAQSSQSLRRRRSSLVPGFTPSSRLSVRPAPSRQTTTRLDKILED